MMDRRVCRLQDLVSMFLEQSEPVIRMAFLVCSRVAHVRFYRRLRQLRLRIRCAVLTSAREIWFTKSSQHILRWREAPASRESLCWRR